MMNTFFKISSTLRYKIAFNAAKQGHTQDDFKQAIKEAAVDHAAIAQAFVDARAQLEAESQQQKTGKVLFGFGMDSDDDPEDELLKALHIHISSRLLIVYERAGDLESQWAKQLLAAHYSEARAHYEEADDQVHALLKAKTNVESFPYIFADHGMYVGGFAELFALHGSGKLKGLILSPLLQ